MRLPPANTPGPGAMPARRTRLEPKPGTYALLCVCETQVRIAVGRLGRMKLQPGFYVYVGSALGPGGVRARVAHHLKRAESPHWHIDHLRKHVRIERVWYSYERQQREHQWAAVLRRTLAGAIPLSGFGASDCACESHLFFFGEPPSQRSFTAGLLAIDVRHPRVHQHNPREEDAHGSQ